MIPREDIQKILEAGVQAPSGENCQPWRFEVQNDQIYILNLPEKDLSLYNFRQLGSFVAHGALIENIIIASAELGYKVEIAYFPDNQNSNFVAKMSLGKSNQVNDPLYAAIPLRSTNRKPFQSTPLTLEQKQYFLNSSRELGEGELRFVDGADKKKSLARALTVSDRLLFEVRKIHDFLFGHISWSQEEILLKKSGFYVKELELAPPQEKAFKLFRNWKILNFFNKLGFSKMAARGNEKLYSACSAFGAVLVGSNTPLDYVAAGRLLQRTWLKATHSNLSIQPITGVLFFMQRIMGGEAQDFSPAQINLVKDAYRVIKEEFDIADETPAMLFRIGYADSPTAHALRLPPVITYAKH